MNINPAKVFLLSISVGGNKPLNLNFFLDSINGLNKAINEGVEFEGKRFNISVRYIICDAQARSIVKCTKLYSGYYGCDKCCQRVVGRMTYPMIQNLPLRTDTAFRNKTQEGHHRGVSPFLQLHNLDIIRDFPLDIPREFARKPRGLDEVERWKRTEFRQFLLYTGKSVVIGILPQHNYDYFMALSVAMCILVNSKLTTQYGNYANQGWVQLCNCN